MKTSVSGRIAFAGVMFALLFAVLYFETAIGIPFIKPSPAFIAIPLAISISLSGKGKMLYGGTMLGVASWVLAFFLYPPFINPLISVLPRVIMGVVAYYCFAGLARVTKKSENKFWRDIFPCSAAGAAGVVINTVGVILMMRIFEFDSISQAISILLSINALFELIAAVIFMPILIKTFRKLGGKIEGTD